MKKYEYIGRRPRNVIYNGVSYPVPQGTVIEAVPGYLENFLPAGEIKEVTDRTAKYRFANLSGFLSQKLTSSMPVHSIPGPPKTKENMTPNPGTTKVNVVPNPYDRGIEKEPKLEVTTNPQPGVTVKTPGETPKKKKESAEFVENTPKKEEDNSSIGTDDEGDTPDVRVYSKTALRKLLKEDLVELAKKVIKDGASLNPDMKKDIKGINDDMHKGPILELMMKYYGHTE